MTNKMTGDEPMLWVFRIKDGCDVARVLSGIIRKLAKQSPVHNGSQRILTVINTEKGRIFVKGHILDKVKIDRFIAQNKGINKKS